MMRLVERRTVHYANSLAWWRRNRIAVAWAIIAAVLWCLALSVSADRTERVPDQGTISNAALGELYGSADWERGVGVEWAKPDE